VRADQWRRPADALTYRQPTARKFLVDHSSKMDSAMKRADKPHRAVFIDDATHQLDRKSDRITLLTEIEKFLLENLGPGATSGS